MSDEHEGYGPQPPGEHDLYRARDRVLRPTRPAAAGPR